VPVRVLAFFPHNPYPPRSGAHHRFGEVLAGLRELGCRVALVGSRLLSETPWTDAARDALTVSEVDDLRIHRPTLLDYAVTAARVLPHRHRGTAPPFDSPAYCPPGLVRLFRRAVADLDPDVLFVSYAFWDRLVDHAADGHRVRVIDTLDMLSLQAAMRTAVGRHIAPRGRVDPAAVAAAALREDYYDRLGLAADPREFAVYDRYSATLAVSPAEAAQIRSHAPHTRTVYLPVTHPVADVANSHEGPPVFVAGNNPYNVQGYCYLARRVMPLVRRFRPDAAVRVVGPVTDRVMPAAGAELAGVVPDLRPVYATARFAVCPVFGGTGQQIKIVEAMAHGLPVVALRAAADRSPLRHGESGLVADTADEFAAHVLALSADPNLCRRLGAAARAVIAADFTRTRMVQGLAEALAAPPTPGTPPGSPPPSAPSSARPPGGTPAASSPPASPGR
jgi:hypothetical protein